MYKHLYKILLSLGVVLLAACLRRDDFGENPNVNGAPDGQFPISFNSSAAEHTRATTPLAEMYDNFGVWAWKVTGGSAEAIMVHATTAEPYFVYNNAKYAGNGSSQLWGYDQEAVGGKRQIIRYWDLAYPQYDFVAYSPYNATPTTYPASTASGVMTSPLSPTAAHTLSISGVTGNFPVEDRGANIDWLWAKTRRTMSIPKDVDMIKPDNIAPVITERTADVPLAFHHLLAKVKFRVKYRDQGEETVTGYVTALSITSTQGFVATADFDETSTPSHFTNLTNDPSYSFPLLPVTPPSPGIQFDAVAETDNIPVDVTPWIAMIPDQTYSMEVHLTIMESERTRDLVTTIDIGDAARWEMDKQYIYTLVIDPNNPDPTYDLHVAVLVADWEAGEAITPPAQTDW